MQRQGWQSILDNFKKYTETSNADLLVKWENLTPIQRNEWICWVTMAKKEETRNKRISRMVEELKEGARQPCCWPGCPHRKPNAKKWFKELDIGER